MRQDNKSGTIHQTRRMDQWSQTMRTRKIQMENGMGWEGNISTLRTFEMWTIVSRISVTQDTARE